MIENLNDGLKMQKYNFQTMWNKRHSNMEESALEFSLKISIYIFIFPQIILVPQSFRYTTPGHYSENPYTNNIDFLNSVPGVVYRKTPNISFY